MHPRVSVSAMCSPSLTLAEDLALWERLGVTNVGVSLRKLEAHGLDEGATLVRDRGLRVTNVLGLGFDLRQRERFGAHQRRLVAAVEAAASMRAECFVLTTGRSAPMGWDDAALALADALAPVGAACEAHGVPLAIEHTNSLRVDVGFVHRLRDAVDLAGRLGIGVVMECNACWAERDVLRTVAEAAAGFRLVQVSDFVVGTLGTPDRVVPGDGDIPLAELLDAVLAAGYGGVFDLEVLGPRVEAEGYEPALRRSLSAMERLLAGVAA